MRWQNCGHGLIDSALEASAPAAGGPLSGIYGVAGARAEAIIRVDPDRRLAQNVGRRTSNDRGNHENDRTFLFAPGVCIHDGGPW